MEGTDVLVHIDFETRSTVDLRKTGADVYAAHGTTEPLCLGYAIDEDRPELWKLGDAPPVELMLVIEDGATVIAHNAPFELAIWNSICTPRYGWVPLPVEQTQCTMAQCYAMGLPGALEKAAAALGMHHQKDMKGSRTMMQLCQPKDITPSGDIMWWDDQAKYQILYDYCIQDVEVEREASKRILALSELERQVWNLDYTINRRGVACDVQAVEKTIRLVEFEQARLDKEIRKVTGNAVATCKAVGQLNDWIKLQGVDLKGVSKSDVLELLDRDLPAKVRSALLLRQEAAKSSTAKLTSMMNRASADGRIRGTAQYHGATTGRWAGRGIQTQNFPRPKIKQKQIEQVFELIEGMI